VVDHQSNYKPYGKSNASNGLCKTLNMFYIALHPELLRRRRLHGFYECRKTCIRASNTRSRRERVPNLYSDHGNSKSSSHFSRNPDAVTTREMKYTNLSLCLLGFSVISIRSGACIGWHSARFVCAD
jgi:hypothetical protein